MTLRLYRREYHRKTERHFLLLKKKENIDKTVPQKTFKLLLFQKECHFYSFFIDVAF